VRLYKDLADHANDLTADHEPIYASVERGDADEAALAVYRHMKRVRDRLLTYLEETNGARL
jgi:DNA-binding GntR family transcriptional regulator